MTKPEVHTYHCICTELILGCSSPLFSLPRRQVDQSTICKISASNALAPGSITLSGSTFDDRDPIIIKLEDGFEKRYAMRCKRCELQIGYWLDSSQFAPEKGESGMKDDVVYLLPGGLITTEEMREGKDMEKEVASMGSAAG